MCIDRALNVDQANENALFSKAMLLKKLGKTHEAEPYLEGVLKVNNQNARAWAELASCLVFKRDRPQFVLDCCLKAEVLGYKRVGQNCNT